jgi:hypothetical protein
VVIPAALMAAVILALIVYAAVTPVAEHLKG